MNKLIIMTLAASFLLVTFVSCGQNNKKFKHRTDLDLNEGNLAQTVNLQNPLISNISENDFYIFSTYNNLNDGNYSGILYLCNNSDNSGCDPKSGQSYNMDSNDFVLSKSIINLNSPNDPGDTLNLLLEVLVDGEVKDSKQTTVTLQDTPNLVLSITNDLDDGELDEGNGGAYFPNGEGGDQVYVGHWISGGPQKLWMYTRFQITKNIPAGATIKSAILRIGGDGLFNWDKNNHYANIYLQDSSDAPQVSSWLDAPNEANGTITVSTVSRWAESGPLDYIESGENVSPNLAPMFQELIDNQGGLSVNSHVQLWLITPWFGSATQFIYADYGNPLHKTRLEITWDY